MKGHKEARGEWVICVTWQQAFEYIYIFQTTNNKTDVHHIYIDSPVSPFSQSVRQYSYVK